MKQLLWSPSVQNMSIYASVVMSNATFPLSDAPPPRGYGDPSLGTVPHKRSKS